MVFRESILFPQFKTNPITGWQISLPKLEKVQINLHRPIPDGFAVKQVRIVKKAMGWFAIISISSDEEIPKPLPHGHFIGVNVGLLNKELGDRVHFCPECLYETDRDIASAQELCNRGLETYPGTLEKHSY